ncbi:MAG: carbamoyl-phosphate synthase small subunit [Francisellaceae bacterium]|jgi:carbamoyl-phosphate synthase small subunit
MVTSKLILKTGEVFEGLSPDWIEGQNFGEIVFNTGMVGYTEVMTDPSYKGQIVVFTYPLIGNYGVEGKSRWESERIHVSGIVVSELAPFYARSQNESSLESWCEEYNIPIISNIDTRALTKVLRDHGVVAGAIVANDEPIDIFPNMDQSHFVADVTIKNPVETGDGEKLLIVVDCGIKANILRYLSSFNIKIKRVPYDYDYSDEDYDGVFISNGPGDPIDCPKTIDVLKKSMKNNPQKPIFGICLGSQIMGLAVGAETYKMKFGHRAQNHPCLLVGTERCYLTSQNHGYSINEDTLPNDWDVMFRNLNDQTVQGVKHSELPYFSVQFHPESGPGPVDTAWLFNDFVEML